MRFWVSGLFLILTVLPAVTCAQEPPAVRILTTPSGIRFGMVGDKGERPAPTMMFFATSKEQTLGDLAFSRVGATMRRSHGFLLVALDMPSHGESRIPGQPDQLKGWSLRLHGGENFVPDFLARARSVLDYLIAEGYTDPARVVASGTSRGGFMALHFTASEPRVRWTLAFAPVTDLLALSEFAPAVADSLVRSLALVHVAPKLISRSLWICIGNADDRVSTDRALAFRHRFVESARAQGVFPDITMQIQPTRNHYILSNSHDQAAAWLQDRLDHPFSPDRKVE